MAAYSLKYYGRLDLFHGHPRATFITKLFAAEQDRWIALHESWILAAEASPEQHVCVPAECVRATKGHFSHSVLRNANSKRPDAKRTDATQSCVVSRVIPEKDHTQTASQPPTLSKSRVILAI